MKKLFSFTKLFSVPTALALTLILSLLLTKPFNQAQAQVTRPTGRPNPTLTSQAPTTNQDLPETTVSLQPAADLETQTATDSTQTASPAAKVEEKIQEKEAEDITATTGEQKSKLAAFLEQNPVNPLAWYNPIQHLIRAGVKKGLPANIIVLLLLFPLVASIIAASRHIVGLRGFGIYIPAVLSVAFVSTEILTGTIIFVAVLLSALLTRSLVKKLKFPYLPRRAMMLWGVSVMILCLLLFASHLALFDILTINIFPILILILLTENFIESQLFNSQKEALKITLETLIIAILCSLIISQEQVQKFVLIYPEVTLLGTVLFNYLIARYTGLRLLEYTRFQSVLAQGKYNYPPANDQSE